MVPTPIYLDSHATTPCDPRVVQAMLPCFEQTYGNAASRQHAAGRQAAALVEQARQQVADLLACEAAEMVFTSGASESNNLALRGAADQARFSAQGRLNSNPKRHLITAATEHKAVLDVCARLEKEGFEVTYLGAQEDGRIAPSAVFDALRPDTFLVSLMLANNEIGTLNPIAEIAHRCRQNGVLVHCDGAQALAYEDCRVNVLGVDLLSLSAHKAYGPKGVGALFVRRRKPRVRLVPQIEGGGHERGHRSGTLNVPGIVGFGKACALISEQRQKDVPRLCALRDRLMHRLLHDLPGSRVNGSLSHRLPNNLNITVPGIDSERLLRRLDGVAISSGAACTSASGDGSYVIRALPGRNADDAASSLRFGLSRFTTKEEIDGAAQEVLSTVEALRRAPAQQQPAACGVG